MFLQKKLLAKHAVQKIIAFATASSTANTIGISSNGLDWTVKSLPANVIGRDCCYGSVGYLLLTNSNTNFIYSKDGNTWISRTLPTSADWYCAWFSNNWYYILGVSGTTYYIYKSQNCSTWTRVNGDPVVGRTSAIPQKVIVLNNGYFVLLSRWKTGSRPTTQHGLITYSANDGANWNVGKEVSGTSGAMIYDIATNGTAVVAVRSGANISSHYIMKSSNMTSWPETAVSVFYGAAFVAGNSDGFIFLSNTSRFYSTNGTSLTQIGSTSADGCIENIRGKYYSIDATANNGVNVFTAAGDNTSASWTTTQTFRLDQIGGSYTYVSYKLGH